MKTKDELNALKEEFETVSRKLEELSEEELNSISGGMPINKETCPGFFICSMKGKCVIPDYAKTINRSKYLCPNPKW